MHVAWPGKQGLHGGILKGIISDLGKDFFRFDTRVRLASSFFPFFLWQGGWKEGLKSPKAHPDPPLELRVTTCIRFMFNTAKTY